MAINWGTQTTWQHYYRMPIPGQDNLVTYGRVAWRHYRGPNPEWGYVENTLQVQYPDHPLNEYRHRVERLVAQFGILPTARILVIGAGIGLLPETFIWWMQQNGRTLAQAQAQVAALDNSQWIQGNVTAEAHPVMFTGTTPKIGNRDFRLGASNAQVRGTLRSIWGNSEFGNWIIVESVDESYTDAERNAAYYSAIESYRSAGTPARNVVHIVAPDWDGRGYWTSQDVGLDRIWTWNLWPAGSEGAPPKTLEQWAATRPTNSWVSYYGDMRAIVGTG